jgi:predicted N-acetyltransferase YhbS
VFVVGEPSYYGRFGFRKVAQPVCPFSPDNEHFMALRYESEDEFQLGYEAEFMSGEPDTALGDGSARGTLV